MEKHGETFEENRGRDVMIRVLVADDERWIRKGIVRMMDCEALGIDEVYEAESVEGAMEIFQSRHPEIVLTDVKFPTENGCDFGDWIYAQCRDTRVVMISAFDDFENARRALHFSAVDYLVKPVSKEQLNVTLRRCIEEIREKAARNGRPEGDTGMEGLAEGEGQGAEEALLLEEEPASVLAIRNLMERIRKEYGKHYTLAELAEECHVAETYFSNLFKKVSGMSPMNYIAKVKIEKSQELMLTTNYKLVRVAEMVGYTDYQYFAKVFKKMTGMTPGEYKGQLQREMEGE